MTRVRRSSLAACALFAGGALALAGCGGSSTPKQKAASGPTPAAKQAVLKAIAKTTQASALVSVAVNLTKPGAPNTLSYHASGSLTPQGGRLTIDRSAVGAGVQNEVFTRTGGRLVLYTNHVLTPLPPGKTWLKVDMTRFGRLHYGADTNFLAGADQDPVEPLQLVQSPVAKVTDAGLSWLPDDTLNHRYDATVNILAAAQAGGVRGTGLTALRKDMGNPTQHIDIWVSKSGVVARVIVRTPEKSPQGTLLLHETTDFSDYGRHAALALPPASKTADYFAITK
jgi:hypothetical protein